MKIMLKILTKYILLSIWIIILDFCGEQVIKYVDVVSKGEAIILVV